jgi:hypothetical protein
MIGSVLAYAKDWSMLVREIGIKNILQSATVIEV